MTYPIRETDAEMTDRLLRENADLREQLSKQDRIPELTLRQGFEDYLSDLEVFGESRDVVKAVALLAKHVGLVP